MNQSGILPFYMTYPLPLYYQQEDSVTRDLEYLQQMYPLQAKKYQRIIAETLDCMDYEGSMIYDEYPDKWQLYRLSQIVSGRIREAEGESCDTENGEISALIQVLVFYEIYRKRHTNRRGVLKF